MPATSTLQQQALDIGYTVMQACQNGGSVGQIDLCTDALASALMILATALNLITINATTVSGSLSATLGTKLTPGGNGFTAATTNVPASYVGTNADPVSFSSILSGAVNIAPSAP
jgi:hypothetical protein